MLAIATLHVAAQDTLRMPINPPENYYYKCAEWMLDTPMASRLQITRYTQSIKYTMIYGFTLPSPLRVIGLAGICDTISIGTHDGIAQIGPEDMDPEYLSLYQPRPGALELKKMVQWNNTQPTHRFQLHIITPRGTAWIYPGLYEVYFDDTVTLQDSFFVGATYLNKKWDSVSHRTVRNAILKVNAYANKPGYHVYPAKFKYRYLEKLVNDTIWHSSDGEGYSLLPVFPIIDTTGMSADTVQGGDTTIVDTTSISPVADQFTYLLPNPATDHATVYSSFPILNVAVFDPAGRCVLRRRVNDRTCHLDLTDYPKGIYLVTLTTPAGRTTKRLMVQ